MRVVQRRNAGRMQLCGPGHWWQPCVRTSADGRQARYKKAT